MKHDDDRLDEALLRMIREMDPPPAVPREEIWAGIQARRAEPAKVVEFRPRSRPWLRWGAPLAAMLVLGIGIGRMSGTATTPVATTGPATAPGTSAVGAAGSSGDAVPMPYLVAASRHLERTEALFVSLGVDAGTSDTGEVSDWAGDLLTDTRLLLASPAGEDPALGRLLEDLELLLAQIAAMPTARAHEEMELIRDGINQGDVLLRLRAATTGPRRVGT